MKLTQKVDHFTVFKSFPSGVGVSLILPDVLFGTVSLDQVTYILCVCVTINRIRHSGLIGCSIIATLN